LGRLGEKPNVSAEVVFADPISDLAVLGPVDRHAFSERQFKAYHALLKALAPFEIGALPDPKRNADEFEFPVYEEGPKGMTFRPGERLDKELIPVSLFSLDRRWFGCKVLQPAFRILPCAIQLEADESIEGGMSGSPIVYEGKSVGVVCTSGKVNPRLVHHLPAWLGGHA
jgi:hypothetical protein